MLSSNMYGILNFLFFPLLVIFLTIKKCGLISNGDICYSLSTQEMEAEGSSSVHSKSEAILGYMRHCLKKLNAIKHEVSSIIWGSHRTVNSNLPVSTSQL